MLLRVRSPDGNFRFDFAPTADVSELLAKVIETAPDADPTSFTMSNQPRGNEAPFSSLTGRSLQALGLGHADLIFVGYKRRTATASTSSITTQPQTTTETATRVWENVTEEPVDVYWRARDGKIPRSRDSRFCTHAAKGMCDYCMPLEPFDTGYHKEHAIKHLSYHAYLKKISPKSTTSATSNLPPLEPLSYKVKVPCPSGHPSWPAGICTACQPSAITLQSQPFRMVDHVEIASHETVERFLRVWRETGSQRFGWLIGHYEPYDVVPMGIKAVVEAIYEPPQEGELDGLTLGLPWEEEQRIRSLSAAASTPLTVVGYIFTDLTVSEEDRTKTIYKRHPGSFYMSSLEAIFAATLQKANPTTSKSSPIGQFGSRLVTLIVTANKDGDADLAAYQVSEQACAMVEADMIEASVDPGIVRVKDEDRSQESARYIPDVFFTYKNEYGLEVKKTAKPAFPVEYLMVNVTHGFPSNPSPLFNSTKYAIENRPGLENQTIESVMNNLANLDAPNIHDSRTARPGEAHKRRELATWLSDWHLVAFLDTTQLFSPDDVKLMMRIVSSPNLLDDLSQLDPLLATEGWTNLMAFTQTTAAASSVSNTNAMDDIPQDVLDQIAAQEAADRASGGGASSSGGIRICPHCTFENSPGGSDCEVCGLPLAS
ncbi:MPN domain-containing protein [Mycena indigotica]|uniref:Nuclear protein localization protein 4 n=1 Tax=Mycena indigotica TaxID=2126181 RepID=A0A8H6W9G4_9AGAR|nr:MPN domain-containing protein [Mycena indigotica]KAF7306588.1 MPN domain-containing protein [Mycena indigotica]